MTGEVLPLGLDPKLLEQAGLADPGLSADVDDPAAARVPALRQRRFELPQFAAPSDKRLAT